MSKFHSEDSRMMSFYISLLYLTIFTVNFEHISHLVLDVKDQSNRTKVMSGTKTINYFEVI